MRVIGAVALHRPAAAIANEFTPSAAPQTAAPATPAPQTQPAASGAGTEPAAGGGSGPGEFAP